LISDIFQQISVISDIPILSLLRAAGGQSQIWRSHFWRGVLVMK